MPSLRHSSAPSVPSLAEKKTLLPTAVSDAMDEDEVPGRMSRTSRVPTAVPSLVHNSAPVAVVEAMKNTRAPADTSDEVVTLTPVSERTRVVPPAVPSVRQSPNPLPLPAKK